jgi:hypothetical protein
MTRLHHLLTMACVAGAAATISLTSPRRAAPTPPAAGVATGTARGAAARSQADQVAWLTGFGTYDARKGTWNFVPNPRGC